MTTFTDLTTLLNSKPKTDTQIQSYVIDMTPEAATRALGENFHNNRKLRRANVKRFTDALSGGYFVAGSTIRFTYDDGKLTLVDGQHRLSAIAQSGCDKVPLTVVVSPGDAAKEYALIDTIQVPRSAADSLAALDANAKTYPVTSLVAYTAAVNVIARNFRVRRDGISRLVTAKVFAEYEDEIARCHEVFGAAKRMPGTPSLGLFKQSALSVVLVTAKYVGREKWDDFWIPVWTDDGLRTGDLRKRLHTILSQPSAGGSKDSDYTLKATVKLWNAYQEGREIKTLRLGGEVEKIVGTPYPM